MYNQEDLRQANALVRRYALILGFGLGALLAAYIAAIFMGKQLLMLAIALTAFWFASLEICLWLRPAAQYKKFLADMNRGLRREYTCTVTEIGSKTILQDGVRVREVHVTLEDGDSRIFYINISKDFPAACRKIRLTAYGRHILNWEELQ